MLAKRALGPAALLLLATAGCTPPPPRYQPALQSQGEVHLYLQPLPQEAHRLTLRISGIAALRPDGSPIPLQPLLPVVEGEKLVGVQKRLAVGPLPPGTYSGISLAIEKASLHGEEGDADLLVPDEPLRIEEEFHVARRAASALFLSLAPDQIVDAGFQLGSSFSLAKPTRQLPGLLGYATSAAENAVFVFNKHTMEIVDVVSTGSGPSGVVVDPRRGWAYVALAGDHAVEAIEIRTGEVLRRLELNFGDDPLELALSRDGRFLVTANAGSNSASIINAVSLSQIGRVSLPSEPRSVVTHPSSLRAYLFQPLSNTLSAIDLSRPTQVSSQILEETPVRGDLSPDGANLYAVTKYSGDLLVLDPDSLQIRARIDVGPGATSLRVAARDGTVYVGKRSGGIEVVDPSSLTAIDRIRVRGHVTYLEIDDEENNLFAVLSDRQLVQRIDPVSKRLKDAVEVGREPYAVAVATPGRLSLGPLPGRRLGLGRPAPLAHGEALHAAVVPVRDEEITALGDADL